ncbi:structural constituent of ribosome [Spatholobus suberectus]|nr:structural constituent of ribosome [Spatholobus suberectus]
MERDHLVADIICGGETLLFVHNNQPQRTHSSTEEFISPRDSLIEDSEENYSTETLSFHKSPLVSDFENDEAEELFPAEDADSVPNSVPAESSPTSPITLNLYKSDLVDSDKNYDEDHVEIEVIENKKVQEASLTRDGRFFVYAPTQLKSKKLIVEEKDDEEIFGDSCTVGSTSKSSSEWRSSINCRDSGTEDPFSSSSRRSCPKWESYTVFQKYDEEMSFLDRISAQKLHETESLRSVKVSPRSISERIVFKFSSTNKKPGDMRHNPYRALEAAYVAQICLTWEALNWNYKNFQSKRASRGRDVDVCCPATIAQRFQQFQVLLQRYVENEPYEHGRRPEIYARVRHLAPKLLLVPEYRESDDDQKDNNGFHSKISSASFLMIMEDGIRTFMSFLKAEKEKPCQILAAYFRRNRKPLVDPTLLRLIKKVNQKKKMKVKDLRRSRKCLRKRKLTVEEEMEILMALIDLKVVSRVLRMSELSEEQLHWCEEKMSKVRVVDGKLQRDSTPLFFPAH